MLLDLSAEPAEDRFQTELRLLLDEVVRTEGPPGFVDAPSTEQLDALGPLVSDGQTAVWLAPPSDGHLRASVAVVRDGRAEVRVVSVPDVDNGPAHLALAVREQLAARLADTPVPPPPPPPSPPPGPDRWDSLGAVTSSGSAGDVRGGLLAATAWRVGPLDRLGPRLAVEAGPDGVWLSPGVALRRGGWTAGSDLMVVQHPWGWQLRPELWTGAQWRVRPSWSVGAALGLLPVRDVVYDADWLRYDSGRVQLTVELLWTPRDDG